jgi:hypothetical protein
MIPLTTPYATDEDVALAAAADFAILCPKDQRLAAGSDGFFDPADRWTLRSTTVEFTAQGLAAGQVVQLTPPPASLRQSAEMLVVSSVAPYAVALRRKGQPPGVGQPPGSPSGRFNIEFLVTTLGPQIERASYDLNRRYGIVDLIAGRRVADLGDRKEVRMAVVLTVLHRRYLDLSREGDQADGFAAKARTVQAELDELLARATIHWGPAGFAGAGAPPTTRFSTRLSR